jgi:hypothetical protein
MVSSWPLHGLFMAFALHLHKSTVFRYFNLYCN